MQHPVNSFMQMESIKDKCHIPRYGDINSAEDIEYYSDGMVFYVVGRISAIQLCKCSASMLPVSTMAMIAI